MNFCKRNFCLIVLLALPVALNAGLEILLEPVVRPARKPTKSATYLLPQTLPHRSVPTTASPVGEEIGLKDNLLTIERLLPFLTESVKSNLHLDGDLRLTPRERWTPFFNKSENLKVEVVDVLPANLGPVSVIQFKVHADNKLIGIWKQAFHAQLFKEILITEEPLARGSFVDVTKFEVPHGKMFSKCASVQLKLGTLSSVTNYARLFVRVHPCFGVTSQQHHSFVREKPSMSLPPRVA